MTILECDPRLLSVGDEFLEALAACADQPDVLRAALAVVPTSRHYERRAIELCLFGCGNTDDLIALVEQYAERLCGMQRSRCRALWLEGSASNTTSHMIGDVPANPWGLDASMDLDTALDQAWKPMNSLGMDLLHQEVLALALLETEAGALALGYLALWRLDEGEGFPARDAQRPPVKRAHCASWAPFAGLRMFCGTGPCEVASLGFATHVPTQLAALWRVHASLDTGMARLDAPDSLLTLEALYDTRARRAEIARSSKSGGLAPSQFLVLFGYGDDASELLSLASCTPESEPQIHFFAAQDWALGEGVPFSTWWPRRLAESFLALDVEDED